MNKTMDRIRNLVADGIGVDAGIIMVGCRSYLDSVPKRRGSKPERTGKVFKVANGNYKIRWKIPHTWNGSKQGTKRITISSGELFVSDPCYLIGNYGKGYNTWCKWLDEHYFNPKDQNGKNVFESDKAFVIDSMGGDGEYIVEMELTYE